MDYITILGSCRLHHIKEYFNTSSILDDLNCPNYTKEILQQIKFLKYRNLSHDVSKICFRSSLLLKCITPIGTNKYNKLAEEFKKSTFFLVEIASRKSYKYKNLYLHHLAMDRYYNFPDINNIIINDLTDEEIEDDILQIRNELYPKPFIILSHFATYEKEKQYELFKLLENICNKFNIPFINESYIINHNNNKTIQNKHLLSNYNEEGIKCVGKYCYDKINEIKQNTILKKTLYQVYYTSPSRVQKYSTQGFGDYIRGTIYLYQLYGNTINLKVNFSHHHLNSFFVCDNYLNIDICEENVKYILTNDNENFLDYDYVFTNNLLIYEDISYDCKKFIIKNCLTPRIYLENKLLNIKQKMNLDDYTYSIIHIRLNDGEIYNENRFNKIIDIIYSIKEKEQTNKLLLIASDEIYLNKINLDFIIKTNLERGHLCQNETTIKECEDTIIEFMLMTTCKKIYQLSVYEWGSGFSNTINKIYDIQIEKFNI